MSNEEQLPPNVTKHQGLFSASYSDSNRPGKVFYSASDAASPGPDPHPLPVGSLPTTSEMQKILYAITLFALSRALNYAVGLAASAHHQGSIFNRVLEILCFPVLLMRLRYEQGLNFSGGLLVSIAYPLLFLFYAYIIAKIFTKVPGCRKFVSNTTKQNGTVKYSVSPLKLLFLMAAYILIYFIVI